MINRAGERGNIFFALFGAVALVGVVGASTSSLMRGPVSTVMSVNQRTKADTQMQIASKLAMVRAAQESNSGDCDVDQTVEPIPPDAMAGLTGGGALPAAIGASQIDPWNTKYGYCAWDLGAMVGEPSCPGGLLPGGNNTSYPVMVIVSAGPDKVFQTACNAWADATPSNAATLIDKPTGSDDIIMAHTYAEAVEAAGGLWSIMSGDPNMITTDKNVAFGSGTAIQFSSGSTASFQGSAQFAPNSRLDLGLGGMFLLPSQIEMPDGQCNPANNGALRINRTTGFNVLEMCDTAAPGFVPLGGAGVNVSKIDDLEDAKAHAGDKALFLGDGAGLLYSSASGALNNIGIGINAASNLSTGDNNLVIGNDATVAAAGTSNSIVLGHGVTGGGDGTMRIGNFLYGANVYSSSGMLGIGGTPSAMLDVAGTAEATRFQVNSSSYMAEESSNLVLGAGGSARIIVESGGNIGIGVADPNVALDVSGDAEVSGNVFGDRIIAMSNGSAAAPAFSFSSSSGLGIYGGGSEIGFSVSGASEMTVDSSGLAVTGQGVFGSFVESVTGFQFATGQGLYGAGAGLSLNTGGSPRLYVDAAGNIGVGEPSPDAALDVSGAIKIGYVGDLACDMARAGSLRYVSGDRLEVCSSVTGQFEVIGTSGGGGGGSGSNWTKLPDSRLYYSQNDVGVMTNDPQADFHVAGNLLSTGTFGGGDTTPVSGAGTRMMFIPNKAAFRAGYVSGAQWDHGSIGDYSVAMGRNTIATALGSTALGSGAVALGEGSFAAGSAVRAETAGSVALGNTAEATGANSMAIGLGVAPGLAPKVSAPQSFGVFMGDQSGVNIATANLMALLGGRLIVDPDASSATNTVPSGLLTVDVQGDVGAIQYCDENGANCFTAGEVAGGGVGVWEDASNVIRLTSGTVSYTSADFVFGSPQLGDDTLPEHFNRMFFDKSKAAFRVGRMTGAGWDDGVVGDNSIALGTNARAAGARSMAMGTDVNVTGNGSFAVSTSNSTVLSPVVSGTDSVVFMTGDRGSMNVTQNNTFGILGFKTLMTATPDLNPAVSGTLTLDVDGQVGAAAYCDADGLNCFNPGTVGSAYGADGTIQFASGGKFWSDANFIYSSATGFLGIGTASPRTNLDIVGTGAIALPAGADAQRPNTPANGMLRYNSASNKFEGYQGGLWRDIVTGDVTTTFLALSDTPATYAGSGLKYVRVNAGTTALEFTDEIVPSVSGHPAPNTIVLSGLGDVDLTVAPTNGQALVYNGTVWEAQAVADAVSAYGADGAIQFVSGGKFWSNANFKYDSATGFLGLGTSTPRAQLDVAGTGAIIVPQGDVGQRPGSPVNGMIRYNSATSKFEGYQAGTWVDMIGGAASFLSLTDTPATYAGAASRYVRVNAGGSALEFTDQIVGVISGEPAPTFISLDDISDVNLSIAPTGGQVLTYNGAAWVAQATGGASAYGTDGTIQFTSGGQLWGNANFTYSSATGFLGLGIATPRAEFDVAGTGSMIVPAGLTAQRPGSPVNGMIRYNSNTDKFEVRQAGTWVDIITGAGGATAFLALADTPGSYAGSAQKYVRVNSGTTGLEFTDQLIGTVTGAPAPNALLLSVLGDVDLSVAPNNGEVLTYNGVSWVAQAGGGGGGGGGGTFLSLSDVPASYAGAANQYVRVNAGSSALEFTDQLVSSVTGEPLPSFANLDDLGDVDLSVAPLNNQVLKYNGTNWVAGVGGGSAYGADGTIQFTSGGQLWGSANFTYSSANGFVGLGTSTPRAQLDIVGTGAMIVPQGDVGQRPGSPVNGMIRYNSANSKFEGYQAGGWVDMVGGGSFLNLADTPGSYAGAANQYVRVNAGGLALEFTDQLISSVTGEPVPDFLGLDDLDDVNLSVAPTNGQVLKYNGTNWVADVGGGVAAGATGEVQYNTGGAFAASSSFVYSSATGLTVDMAGANAGDPLIYGKNSRVSGVGVKGEATGASFAKGVYGIAKGGVNVQGVSGLTDSGMGVYGFADAASGTTYGVYGQATSATGYGVYSNGNMHVAGNITYTGTLTDVSDMRLKTDIHPLRDRGSMLDRLGQVGTYTFRMKDDAKGDIEYGVMAQELKKIFPELVLTDMRTPENYMSVNYIGLISPIIAATQELKAENDNLKMQLSTMETRMAAMESDMGGLKVHTGYGIGKAGFGLGMIAGLGLIGGGVALFRRRRKAA